MDLVSGPAYKAKVIHKQSRAKLVGYVHCSGGRGSGTVLLLALRGKVEILTNVPECHSNVTNRGKTNILEETKAFSCPLSYADCNPFSKF